MKTEEKKTAKKRVNSKAKGSSNELKISKILSQHLAPLNFKRSQQSGAIVGGQNSFRASDYSKLTLGLFTGDVVPANECVDGNPRFKFVVECKAYKEAERMEALFGTSHIYAWLEEVKIDAAKIDKRGIVIFKFNNTPLYCAVESDMVLPEGLKMITILNGVKVCHFDDLVKHPSFWMS